MNIALLFTGQIRNAIENFDNFNNFIIDRYKPDIFINSWTTSDTSIDELCSLYKPISIELEDFSRIDKTKILKNINNIKKTYHETRVENVYYQYYKINKGYQNIINFQKDYDIVIRARFDLRFEDFPDLNHIDLNKIYIPLGWDWRDGYSDLLSWGGVKIMENYCNLYNNLGVYANDDTYFHPEALLKYHLDKLKITPERIKVNYYLREKKIYILEDVNSNSQGQIKIN